MRSYARLLAPVLLAGALVACSGGEDSVRGLPTVKGEYGTKPVVKVEKGSNARAKLRSQVLSKGDGPKVKKGDLLVADYLGKNVRSRQVFDNSYDRGAPAAFVLKDGPGGVISGWVKTLAGVPVGSRVLLVAPPKEGYGKSGNPDAGIKGSDALAFVVDIIAAYPAGAPLPKSTPVPDLPATLPQVEGTAEPTLTVPEDAEPPTEDGLTVISEGSGKPLKGGNLAVLQFKAVTWNNQPVASTWETGPQGRVVDNNPDNPFAALEGVPVGSRAILQVPAPPEADPQEASIAVVIDVLGQHGSAKKVSK